MKKVGVPLIPNNYKISLFDCVAKSGNDHRVSPDRINQQTEKKKKIIIITCNV